MPQRREDYMSTKNVGGNRGIGSDSGPANDPFGYLKLKPEHAYLGHFKAGRFLREGHNVRAVSAEGLSARRVRRTIRSAVRAPGVTKVTGAKGAFEGTVSQVSAAHPMLAARTVGRQAVRIARRTGGDVAAAKQARQALVSSARKSPQTARAQIAAGRRARRGSNRSNY